MSAGEAGFSKRRRLIRPGDFKQVFAKQQFRARDDGLIIIAAANGLNEPRLGLAISKKSIPTAVGRNRVKRLARESFRQYRADLPPLDIVVMTRAPAGSANNRHLLKQFHKHWQRLNRQWQASRQPVQ